MINLWTNIFTALKIKKTHCVFFAQVKRILHVWKMEMSRNFPILFVKYLSSFCRWEMTKWSPKNWREHRAGVNFINVKHANFTYKRLFSSYVLALNELSYKKHPQKTLTKLSIDVNFISISLESFCTKLLLKKSWEKNPFIQKSWWKWHLV